MRAPAHLWYGSECAPLHTKICASVSSTSTSVGWSSCTDGRPANAEHTTLDDGARVGTLTTRRIEEDEEVLVDYGEAYWEARR